MGTRKKEASTLRGRVCERCGGSGIAYNDPAVGLELRRERVKENATLREIAPLMGYKFGYVSELERGTRRWTKAKIDAYRKAIQQIIKRRARKSKNHSAPRIRK